MISFRNLILDFCSNDQKILYNELLKYHKQLNIFIKLYLNKKIKKLSSGILYELGIYFLFDNFKFKFSTNFKFKNLIPDCKIQDVFIEVKGYRHDMSGTADEKNIGIGWKYYNFNNFQEKLIVIFCGKITKIKNNIYPKFLGYYKFDDFLNYNL